MNHIDNDRLHRFAIEAIELTEVENTHLDDCATCCGRLVVAVRLVVLEADSEKSRLVI